MATKLRVGNPDHEPRRQRHGVHHRARELLNMRALLVHCMKLPDATESEGRRWARELAATGRALEAMYAGGLDRSFPEGPAV